MKTLRLYHITPGFIGNKVKLEPNIPDLSGGDIQEEDSTPRICCALSILSCVRAKELIFNDEVMACKGYKFFAYYADAPIHLIYKPTVEQVPDSWITDEFWLKSAFTFTFDGMYVLRKHMDIGEIYSRYAVTRCEPLKSTNKGDMPEYGEDPEWDEVIDRLAATWVYGDPDAFSFIDIDMNKRNALFQEKIGNVSV